MTKIVVTITKADKPLPAGVAFAATSIAVTDNAGVRLQPVSVNGTESPPWTAEFTGTEGTQEAFAIIQDLDTTGQGIGDPITVTETGTGGQPTLFKASTGASISVT